jgi:hypothetical protein
MASTACDGIASLFILHLKNILYQNFSIHLPLNVVVKLRFNVNIYDLLGNTSLY